MSTKMHLEGLTLTVQDVQRSVDFYCGKLGFTLEWNALPRFAMLRLGGAGGTSLGLLAWTEAVKDGCELMTRPQAKAVHVELTTDDLDGLYRELQEHGVQFETPPHDEPWERSMTARDPDGYAVEFAEGRRGKKA
jgi:catechol 2,3-dioxygenase-like lactoylglutathione lyase family enzyme